MRSFSLVLFLLFAGLCSSAAAETESQTVVADTLPADNTRSVVIKELQPNDPGIKYWHRYKTYKTCAWTTLSIGGAAALTGIVGKAIDKSTNENYTHESNRHWNIPIFAGLGVAATSVPLFMCANHAKQYAVEPPSTPIVTIKNKSAKKKHDADVINDKSYKQTKYWKRHNVYKTCAWSAMGLGIASFGAGTIVCMASLADDHDNNSGEIGGTLVLSGIGLSAASIPMFILAYRNKYKAKESVLDVSLNATGIPTVSALGQTQIQPALGISVNF